jgi:hypothetical protein
VQAKVLSQRIPATETRIIPPDVGTLRLLGSPVNVGRLRWPVSASQLVLANSRMTHVSLRIPHPHNLSAERVVKAPSRQGYHDQQSQHRRGGVPR